MKIDNPLSREFLIQYPVEAARALELVSVKHVAALFTELPLQTGAPVMASMLPEKAAACQESMAAQSAARLMNELAVSSAARIYRLLSTSKQDEVSGHMKDKTRRRLHRYIEYPSASAGALLEPAIDILTVNMTVADAIRRIERLGHSIKCEIYIIDDEHRLLGMIDLGRLMTSPHHARLKDIMHSKTQPISVYAAAETLLMHPGWETRRSLPVVERDNTLVGMLHFNRLREATGEMNLVSSRDPLESLLSLASLYWLSVAQLLDGVLGTASSDKGKIK